MRNDDLLISFGKSSFSGSHWHVYIDLKWDDQIPEVLIL